MNHRISAGSTGIELQRQQQQKKRSRCDESTRVLTHRDQSINDQPVKTVVGGSKEPTEVRVATRATRDGPGVSGEPGVLDRVGAGHRAAGCLAKAGDTKT